MQETTRRSVLANSILVFWVVLCFSVFVILAARVSYLHEFFFFGLGPLRKSLERVDLLPFLGKAVISFIGTFVYSAACVSGGLFLSNLLGSRPHRLHASRLQLVAYLVTAFLLGQILISTIFIFLGAVLTITPAIDLVALVVMFSIGFESAWSFIRSVYQGNISQAEEANSGFFRALRWLCVLILLLAVFYSSTYLSYDATAVYFSNEKLSAVSDRLLFFPNDSFIVSSFHAGIQYTMLIQLFGDQAARLFSWFNGLFFLALSLALAELLGLSRRAIYLLSVLILTSTAFLDLMGDGKVDLLSSVFALSPIYWMVLNSRLPRGQIGTSLLIGILFGFATLARPFNLPLLILFMGIYYGWVLVIARRKGMWALRDEITAFGWIVAGAFPLLLFHLVMNQLILGDFLAPLANVRKMGGPAMWQWSFDPRYIWLFRALYLPIITFWNSPQSLGNISPLILAFLPTLLFPEIRKHVSLSAESIRFSLTAAVTLLLWIWVYHTIEELRYVLFLWTVVMIPVAVLLERCVESPNPHLSGLTKKAVLFLLALLALRTSVISLASYSPLNSQGIPKCFGKRVCDFLQPINERAGQGDRVLTLTAYRYYLRVDLFACSTKAQEYYAVRDAARESPERFWIEAYRQGYHYVAFEQNYALRHLFISYAPNPADAPSWLNVQPIYGHYGDEHVSYGIEAVQPALPSRDRCSRNSSGIWMVGSAEN